MTQFAISNIGSYPRIGEDKDQQRHRRGLTNFENKEISAHAFRDVEQSVIQEIIREQISYGLDEITDGLISWQDPISHFCKNISGIKMGGLLRYFDMNFYYRVPTIASKPRIKISNSAQEYEFAKSVSTKPVRAVLTGPLTLAWHTRSTIKGYDKLKTRMEFFADVISLEIDALKKSGATLIQLDEPALRLSPESFPLFRKLWESYSRSNDASTLVLSVTLGPLNPLLERLLSLPYQRLHLDFSYDGEKLFEKLMSLKSAPLLEFGIVNARNTAMEPIDPLTEKLKIYCRKFSPEYCRLSPSSGLEFLPRETAQTKLHQLSKIKETLINSSSSQFANA